MNLLQIEIENVSKTIDALSADRLEIERQHARWANSIKLADMGPGERAKAPEMRGRLIQRITEIDRELSKVEQERRAINERHLATSKAKMAAAETPDTKSAAKLVGDLELKREVIQETIARLEKDRSAILLSAVSGDTKSKAEAARLAGQIAQAIADASDIEAGLSEARKNLLSAKAEATAKNSAQQSDAGRKIGSEAAADAEEFDRLITQAVEILDRRHARTNQLLKLGTIDSTTANRIRNQRVILGALLRAGMKAHISDLSSIGGSAWLAETDRALFPTMERASVKAA